MAPDGERLEDVVSRFCASTRWDAIPAEVRDRTLDLLLDAVANAVAGRAAESTPTVEALVAELCGPGDHTVVGGDGLSATGAVFVNAHQITAYTMCDVYRPALCHITPEVLPPLLEVASAERCSGRDLLAAFAVGLEVTARLGLGVDYPRFRQRGWHAPDVIGAIGAAAAVARLLRFDQVTTRRALGLAVSQASGTFAALGTPAVKFHQARGAVAGLWAARFAARGLGGPEHALTHPDGGLLTTYADGGRPDLAVADLGQRWELLAISMRRWPAASSLQSLVGCVLDLRARQLTAPADVEQVVVALPTGSFAMCAHMGWPDELTAMQSARYVATAVLHDGDCWIEQFGAERRVRLSDFASERVGVVEDPALPPTGARVTVGTGGGRHEVQQDEPLGDPRRPLPRAEVEAKLLRAADVVSTAMAPQDLIAALDGLAGSPDVDPLVRGLRAPRPTTRPDPAGRDAASPDPTAPGGRR